MQNLLNQLRCFIKFSKLTKRRKLCLLICYCCIINCGFSQQQNIADSLRQIYNRNTATDTIKLQLLLDLSFNEIRDNELGLKYAEELITSSQQLGNNQYLRTGYFLKGEKEKLLGRLDNASDDFFKSAALAQKLNNLTAEGDAYSSIADVYSAANNHENAELYYNKAIIVLRKTKDTIHLASTLNNAADEQVKIKNYDSALSYFNESKFLFTEQDYTSGVGYSTGGIGMAYAGLGKNDLAEKNINNAIKILKANQDYYPICDYLISMADVYADKHNNETAIKYASESLQLAQQYKLIEQVSNANLKLSELYEKSGDANLSLKYFKHHIIYRDSLNNIHSIQKIADLRTTYEVSKKQTEVNLLNQQKTNQRNLVISLIVILVLTIIILFVLIKNNRHKQKAYEVLNLQKKETDEQKLKAETAFDELKKTQAQLIQSEKMASLGELTAGIAHEIQNPLNFVNNFSEVNNELIEELKTERQKQNERSKEIEDGIINDIQQNLEKINVHGKRADAIVKGMLQHSRQVKGTKEPTDINALCDQFIRLSYHGLRAKDKSFNADFKTDFDTGIHKINIVPQDIGRVLLNLFNNAFYAVDKKIKDLESLKNPKSLNNFKSLVFVQTKKINGGIRIKIEDNGNGISSNIIHKIFQPFFTTKPSGQGTGLGLSLAYDIITKEHGGTIKAESKEGEGTAFIIELPVM